MPHRCVVNGCAGSSNRDVVKHRFPNFEKYQERFKIWVNLVGGKLETASDYKAFKNKRVCDIHFTERDKNRYHRLNALAVPSLHIPGSHKTLLMFPNPAKARERFNRWVLAVGGDIIGLDSEDILKHRGPFSLPTFTFTERRPLRQVQEKSVESPPTPSNSECLMTASSLTEKQNNSDDIIMENDEPPGDELPDDTADDGTIDLTQTDQKKMFSWTESEPITLDETPYDVVPDGSQPKGTGVQNEETPTSDNQPPVDDYCCDGCKENITGFRYTCVQCADYDLCGACERLMLHAQHYVLRVPPGKSAKEVRLILEAIRMKLDTIDYDLGIIKIKKEEDPFKEVANENENLILATSTPDGVADASSGRDEVPNVSKTATGDVDENVGHEDDMSFTEDWLDEPLLEMYEDAEPLQPVSSKDTVEPSISKQSGEKHMRNIEKSNKEPIIKLLSPLETHESDKQSGSKQCSLLKLPPRQILKRKSEITNSEPKKLLQKISAERTTQSVSNQRISTSRVTEEADVEKEKGIERRCHTALDTYAEKPSSDPRLSTESKFIKRKYVKRK